MLNVMSLNCANYDDHQAWDARLPLIVNAIVQSNADIIGLTEIRYTAANFFNTICQQFWDQYSLSPSNCPAMDMGQQILTLLQTNSAYANAAIVTNVVDQYSGSQWEGMSVIYRPPLQLINSGYEQFDGSVDLNTRGIQWLQLQTQGGNTVFAYNTHFALDEQGRLTNAQQTLQLMGSNLNGLAFVIGDMNATPDDQAMQNLAAGGLTDVWAAAYPNVNGYTFPSWGPVKRIDYCWASQAMAAAVAGVRIVPTSINGPVMEAAGGVLFASDHIGLLTAFNTS